MPMNAGNRSFRKFIIAFNIDTTAPGFVTKSFKLDTFKKFFAAPPIPPAAAAPAAASPPCKACASAATANNSGARLPVIFVGSCAINFFKKLGK